MSLKRLLIWFLGVLLVGGALALAVLHRQREALAVELANDLLAESGFRVSDLSMTRLVPDELAFSSLTLMGSDGARYEMTDVSVALSLPDPKVGEATIGAISVSPGTPSTDSLAVIALLDQLLALPEQVPGTTVHVGQLQWGESRPVTDVEWQTLADQQTLRATVSGYRTSLGIDTQEPNQYQLRLTVDPPNTDFVEEVDSAEAVAGLEGVGAVDGTFAAVASGPSLAVEAQLKRQPESYALDGSFRGELLEFLALTDALDQSPAWLDALSGRVEAPFAVSIADSGGFAMTLKSNPTLDGFETTVLSAERAVDVRSTAAFSLEVGFVYPGSTWSLKSDSGDFEVSVPPFGGLDLAVNTVECTSATGCSLSLAAAADSLALSRERLSKPRLSADVSVAGNWRGVEATLKELSIDQIVGEGWVIGQTELETSANPSIAVDGDGRLSSDVLSLQLNAVSVGEDLRARAILRLRDLVFDPGPGRIQSRFEIPGAPSRLQLGEWEPTLPDFAGEIDYQGQRGAIPLRATDPRRALSALMDVQLSATAVEVTIKESSLGFDTAPLSDSLSSWPWEWDLEAGVARLAGKYVKRLDGSGPDAGQFTLALNRAAFRFGDIAATDVNAENLPVSLGPGGELTLSPAPMTADLIDVGIPLTNFGATLSWESATNRAFVEDMRAELLGGRARVDPFALDTQAMTASLNVHLDAVQLQFMADMARLEQVKVTGALSGTVPVEVMGSAISADAGQLESDQPGVIRYQSTVSGDPDSGLNVATRALSNLEYESLTSKVSYSENGDLVLKMRLKGINPDMDPLQPVILNLSVENNIPQLLRSLQAARDIEQIIESRSGR